MDMPVIDAGDVELPSEDDLIAIAETLVKDASAEGITLATAESCTGGLVAGAITGVPGSSSVLLGGVVSYSLAVKRSVLGVSPEVLDTFGAVSSECAHQMCDGARTVTGAKVAVSITGIAGPGGAEPGKPVGTVWFGVATPFSTTTVMHVFSGDRRTVRFKAVATALGLLHGGVVEAAFDGQDEVSPFSLL